MVSSVTVLILFVHVLISGSAQKWYLHDYLPYFEHLSSKYQDYGPVPNSDAQPSDIEIRKGKHEYSQIMNRLPAVIVLLLGSLITQ